METQLKNIKIPKNFFKKMKFKIEVSPFGKKPCCCGYINCVDIDCFNYCNVRHVEMNNMTLQEYEEHEKKSFNSYENP